MKLLLLVFAAILGANCADNELNTELIDFTELIPFDEVTAITDRYLQNEDFVRVLIFVLYDEVFKQVVYNMEKLPEFLEMIKYLEDSGLAAYAYLDDLNASVGLPPFIRPDGYKDLAIRGDVDMVVKCRDEVRGVLPQDEITALHQKKLVESPVFKYLADRLESEELGVIMKNLYESETYRTNYQTCLDNGLEWVDNFAFYLELFGFRDIKALEYLKRK